MAKPNIALIPAAQGSKLFSVLPSSGVGDFDFSRSGKATRINSQGLIEEVANGQSRLNYPMIDGKVVGCPHHILEPARTNLQTYSSDLASVYIPTNITQTSNYGISPDGTLNSTRLVLSNLTDSRSVETLTGVLTNGTTYTFSCYYKGIKGETTYMYFLSSTGGTSISKEIIFTGKWQRESITFTAGSASNYTYIVDARQGSSTATDFEVWGGQVEQGSYPTSYIPNNGESGGVTRSAETANGSGDADTFNDSEGVLMAEIQSIADTGNSGSIYLGDGGISNRMQIVLHSGGLIKGFITGANGGVTSVTESNVKNYDSFHKVSLTYNSTKTELWIDGFKLDSDNGDFSFNNGELSTLRFSIASEIVYGKTKQVQYYNSALTDSELEQLTSWVSFTDMAQGQLYTIE